MGLRNLISSNGVTRSVASYLGFIPEESKINVIPQNFEDAKESSIKSVSKAIVVPIYSAFKRMFRNSRSADTEDPNSQLTIIKNALKVESYFRRAKDRYIELIWKNGYDFIGKNKKATKYIKRRLKEISYVTRKPTYKFFEEVMEQLVPYYNCFILKVRNKKSSSGTPHKYFGKTVDPIVGLFVLDCTKVSLKKDSATGEILGYEYDEELSSQSSYSWGYGQTDKPFFDFRDVVHITMAQNPGDFNGEPPAFTVLDDIRALRRMEENVEILVFQHTIPLFQYRVGNPEKPAKPLEVDNVKIEVENMLTQGMLVIPERHEIKAIGVEREALDVSKYLEYFKNRILIGLGHNTASLGEAGDSNRSTAITTKEIVNDGVRRFQTNFKVNFDDFVITDILLETNFDPFDEDSNVETFIPEIEIDSKIRKEYHALQMYQGNVITEDEVRKDIGRDPFTEKDRKNTYFEMVTKPKSLILAVDEPYTKEAKAASAGASREVPNNQNGNKKVGAPKRLEKTDSMTCFDKHNDLKIISDGMHSKLKTVYDATRDEILMLDKDEIITASKSSINLSKSMVVENTAIFVIGAFKCGLRKTGANTNINFDSSLVQLHKLNEYMISQLYTTISDKINDNNVNSVFNSLSNNLKLISDYVIEKAFWAGIVAGKAANNIDKVDIKTRLTDGSNVELDSVVYSNNFTIDQIPPFNNDSISDIYL